MSKFSNSLLDLQLECYEKKLLDGYKPCIINFIDVVFVIIKRLLWQNYSGQVFAIFQ